MQPDPQNVAPAMTLQYHEVIMEGEPKTISGVRNANLRLVIECRRCSNLRAFYQTQLNDPAAAEGLQDSKHHVILAVL